MYENILQSWLINLFNAVGILLIIITSFAFLIIIGDFLFNLIKLQLLKFKLIKTEKMNINK